MYKTVEEITINYIENGQELTQELEKVVLSKGAWVTILFRYREWSLTKEKYGEEKYGIRRYQKRNGEYKQHSKLNISSKIQAQLIVDALQRWLEES